MEYSELSLLREKLLKDVSLDFEGSDLRVAVIGFGKMGLLHSAILNLLKSGSVRFIVDKSRLISLGGSILIRNVKFLRSLEKLLKEDFNVAYVTTPTQTHFLIVKRLVEAGVKAIFIEKPPTRNLQEFMELYDMIRDNIVMVGFQKRYAMPFRHAKMLIQEGIMGNIEEVRCYIKSGDVLSATTRFDALGRGVLLDLGVHLADLLCWFFGNLEVVEAESRSIYTRVDDFFRAKLRARSIDILFETTWSDSGFRLPETYIEIRGSDSVLKATEDYVKLTPHSKQDRADHGLVMYRPHYYQGFPPVLVADPEYTIEDMHFLSCIEKKIQPETSLESCSCAMRILEETYQSAHHG